MALLSGLRNLLFFILLFGLVMPVYGDELKLQEQEIKAGLLYNFLKYTDWPAATIPSATAPLVVCVFGGDPFDGYLQPMAGRTVNQREITVRNVQNIADTTSCHLLYVNASAKDRWPELQKLLIGKNVLTVSDFREFCQSGGMIEFGRKDNHINVDLNIDAVARAGLHIQDRLLKLVTIVHFPDGGQ